MEKRNSIHEAFVSQQQTINSNDEGPKWILEPLVLSPLDPTTFLRKELFEVCLDLNLISKKYSFFFLL